MFSRDFTDIKSGESFDTEWNLFSDISRGCARRNTVVPISSSLYVLKRGKLLLFIVMFFFNPWPTYFHKERNKIQVF